MTISPERASSRSGAGDRARARPRWASRCGRSPDAYAADFTGWGPDKNDAELPHQERERRARRLWLDVDDDVVPIEDDRLRGAVVPNRAARSVLVVIVALSIATSTGLAVVGEHDPHAGTRRILRIRRLLDDARERRSVSLDRQADNTSAQFARRWRRHWISCEPSSSGVFSLRTANRIHFNVDRVLRPSSAEQRT